MNVKETLSAALKSLLLNKIRSFLTMLGVIIGVFAVISLVSLVGGIQNYVEDQFEDLGSNLIFVVSGNVGGGSSRGFGSAISSANLKEKHVDMIKSSAKDYIEIVSPQIQTYITVKYKTHSEYTFVFGVSFESDKLFNSSTQKGRYFSRTEQNNSARVAVLGYLLANDLFGDENPVNKTIKVDGKSYEVVGVLAQKSPDYDESIILPYTTVMDNFDKSSITAITAKAKKGVDLEEATRQVELALLRDLGSDQFTVMTQEDVLQSIDSILNILTIALVSISGISLLVGGIGIMNIMLVSVTERTKEIGLRKALGATSNDIKRQFMIEAVLISMSGGIIGLILGWLSTVIIRNLIKASVPFWAIPLALGFSVLVGVVFGTYPAVKASKKDPIEALRYE